MTTDTTFYGWKSCATGLCWSVDSVQGRVTWTEITVRKLEADGSGYVTDWQHRYNTDQDDFFLPANLSVDAARKPFIRVEVDYANGTAGPNTITYAAYNMAWTP